MRFRIAPLRGALPAVALAAAVLAPAMVLLSACDATQIDGPVPDGPDPIAPITASQEAIVTAAFEEVEDLFDLGFNGTSAAAKEAAGEAPAAQVAMRALVDTTTYTGIYDGTNSKGYLVQMQYRQPQGVGVWQARVQHARAVDHDNDGGTPDLDAVESVTLTFLSYNDLDAFIADLGAGSIPYLLGTSDDAEASFQSYDTWRVAQVYSPGVGEAVVSYANAQLRESVTVREPIVTRNTNGTGTVRDGGADGAVRTRYYAANFAVDAQGNVTGDLLRTLSSSGDTSDGSLVSRNDYVNGTFRQTKQRGGDGVVIRENTVG